MKKIIMICILFILTSSAFADLPTVDIFVDENKVNTYDHEQGFDVPAVIYNSRSMLPLKKTFSLFGIKAEQITWNADDQSIEITTNDNDDIWMQIGNPLLKLNDEVFKNDVAPILYKNRTFVPLAVISQILGANAIWDQETFSVTLDLNHYTIPEYNLVFFLSRTQGFSSPIKYKGDYYLSKLGSFNSESLISIRQYNGGMSDVLLEISEKHLLSSEDFTIFERGYYRTTNESSIIILELSNGVYELEFTEYPFDSALDLVMSMEVKQ